MSWHPAYFEQVLAPDYRFAVEHLRGPLLDAMTAHVRTVARLPSVQADPAALAATDRLVAAIVELHAEPLPEQVQSVPDAYFAVNRLLEERLGAETVSFLRTGLSRNDLDMTVYKLAARQRNLELAAALMELRGAVQELAADHADTVLIAHTHHQPGQPTTVAHYLLAIDSMISRDQERVRDAYGRLNTSPLGAAALAGSSHPLDRHYTAGLLGFDRPVANTIDAVAASDWQAEAVANAGSVALNLSRFTWDLLNWATSGLFRLADGLVQGSSIMPQKRNPVALEHARTRFSRVLGSGQQVIFSSHNISYTDLNDFGPDIQGSLRQQHQQLLGGLTLLTACLRGGDFDRTLLQALATATDTTATELADVLVRDHNVSFQKAHELVAAAVAHCRTRGVALLQLSAETLHELGGPLLTEAELHDALAPESFVARRSGHGGPAREVVLEQLGRAQKQLDSCRLALQNVRNTLDGAFHALRVPGKEDQ